MSGTREIVGVDRRRAPGGPETAGGASTLRSVCAASSARGLARRPHGRDSHRVLAPSVRAAIRRFDANLAVSEVTVLESASRRRDRAPAVLHGAAGALRGARARTRRDRHLRCHELYGCRAHSRDRHPPGAWRPPRERRAHDRRQGCSARADGAVIGVAGALAIGRVIRNQLFGVEVLDPLTLSL